MNPCYFMMSSNHILCFVLIDRPPVRHLKAESLTTRTRRSEQISITVTNRPNIPPSAGPARLLLRGPLAESKDLRVADLV